MRCTFVYKFLGMGKLKIKFYLQAFVIEFINKNRKQSLGNVINTRAAIYNQPLNTHEITKLMIFFG